MKKNSIHEVKDKMKEREYKGWEIIKLLEEGKLKDGTKINVIKETGETYDCIVSDKELYFVGEFSLGIRTSIRNERFVENSIFKIEKEIEYMTFQEVAITGKRLRLNEEWSKKIRDDYEEVFEDKQREEDRLVVSYLSGEYLSLQDMLIVLGWFLSGEDLRELLSSNEKVWCVEE